MVNPEMGGLLILCMCCAGCLAWRALRDARQHTERSLQDMDTMRIR